MKIPTAGVISSGGDFLFYLSFPVVISERTFYNMNQTNVWGAAMERVILHSDCNSFYAAVECLHRPKIRNKPVAVGGDVEQRHGIILAKNELAKKYHIQTGEALWQAKQKCPDLIIVPPNFPLYLRFSRLAQKIYLDYTNQVEPYGLDECWLDVTGSRKSGTEIAHEIRERIKFELGITVSIGVSYNKIFAKLGSDYKKPNAVTEISRQNFKDVAWPLPASDLLYVGRATRRKLESYRIHTIGDLANYQVNVLRGWFGKWGEILHCFANGYDVSPVADFENQTLIKSIGNSTTTPRDLTNDEEVKMILYVLTDSVCRRLREQGFKGRTVSINARDNQLSSVTRQYTMSQYTNITDEIMQEGYGLFQRTYKWQYPVRSIGINISNLVSDTFPSQTNLFANEMNRQKKESLDATSDWLKRRFGSKIIQPASLLIDTQLSGLDPKQDHIIHPVGYF